MLVLPRWVTPGIIVLVVTVATALRLSALFTGLDNGVMVALLTFVLFALSVVGIWLSLSATVNREHPKLTEARKSKRAAVAAMAVAKEQYEREAASLAALETAALGLERGKDEQAAS